MRLSLKKEREKKPQKSKCYHTIHVGIMQQDHQNYGFCSESSKQKRITLKGIHKKNYLRRKDFKLN